MKPFQPRFAIVSRIRENERDAKRQALADAYRAESILRDQKNALETQIAEVLELRRQVTHAKKLQPSILMTSQRHEHDLRAQVQKIEDDMGAVREEIGRRQQDLILAEKEVRTLEILNERREAEHRIAEERERQKQLDEVASRRYWQQQNTQEV